LLSVLDTPPLLDTPSTALPFATIREIASGNTLRQANHDLVQRNTNNDEWARLQGAMDFAASLLSIASSYKPEVFRCLSQLILSTLEQTSESPRPASDRPGSSDPLETSSMTNPATVTSVSRNPANEPKASTTHKTRSATQSVTQSVNQPTNQSTVALRVPVLRLQQPKSQLTASERRVAELVSQGLSLKKAAAQLFISAKTVEFHLQSVYRKLDVHNRGEFATVFFTLQNAA
jgi:DNA-binding CsgD family transcriptional regulator